MTISLVRVLRGARQWLATAAVVATVWGTSAAVDAQANAAGPNAGALTFTGGIDVPSVYVQRGFVQERSPKLTLTPYGDLGIALSSGPHAVRVHLGIWNSLQTGSSGTDGFTEHLHYAENFYASVVAGVSRALSLEGTYTAYTSPNFQFDTVSELSVKVVHASRLAPFALVAADLGDHSFDGGSRKGSYFETGVAPRFPVMGSTTVTVPVRVGASLQHYYELNGVDHRFGFLDAGAVLTRPLTSHASRFGVWNVHGGVEAYLLGDTTRAFNAGKKSKVVASAGLGVTY